MNTQTQMAAIKRAEELRTPIDEAAQYVSNVYVTYLLASVYIAVAVASTTDRQLLVGSKMPIPLLTVELPIEGFYVVVPFALLLFHLYLLLQIYFLSVKQTGFEETLKAIPSLKDRQQQRTLLLPFVITPLSIQATRHPLVRSMLWLIVGTTVLVMPPLILELSQIRFLPYHSVPITAWHRLVLSVDLVVLWVFWLLILERHSKSEDFPPLKSSKLFRHLRVNATLLIAGVFWSYAMFVATIPDEFLDRTTNSLYPFKKSLHRNLVVHDTTLVLEEPQPPVVAALIQQGKTVHEAQRLLAKGVNLQERDLRYADLSDSTLVNADLRGATLDFANLEHSNFQGANLGPLKRTRDPSDLRVANRGANADNAEVPTSLRGVNLRGADFRHALLGFVDLSGAEISSAELEGASLNYAKLLGVKQVHGLDLERVFSVDLRGANMIEADLRGADLRKANLQGADLAMAKLQGADLSGADLTGTSLIYTNANGANLRAALLDLTNFDQTILDPLPLEENLQIRQELERALPVEFSMEDSSPFATPGDMTTQVDSPSRIQIKNAFYSDSFADLASVSGSLESEEYAKELIAFLVDLSCDSNAVAKSLALRSVFSFAIEMGDPDLSLLKAGFARRLSEAILESETKDKCKGVKDLPPDFHEGLRRLAKTKLQEAQ